MLAPSYEQNAAKIGEIHGTVNLGFKRPVHEGYKARASVWQVHGRWWPTGSAARRGAKPKCQRLATEQAMKGEAQRVKIQQL